MMWRAIFHGINRIFQRLIHTLLFILSMLNKNKIASTLIKPTKEANTGISLYPATKRHV